MTFHRPIALVFQAILALSILVGGVTLIAQSDNDLDKPAIRRPGSENTEASPSPGSETESEVSAPAAAGNNEGSDQPSGEQDPGSTDDSEDTVHKLTPLDSDAEAEAKAAEIERMNTLFPIGRVFEGVKMPSYSGDALSSVVHADFMRRADGEHLEMEMMEIVNYNAGEPDSRIITDRAIYDIEAKTMRSTTPAKIVNPQFEMRGDRMIFDSVTGIGHMIGNVVTHIEQAEQFVSPGN